MKNFMMRNKGTFVTLGLLLLVRASLADQYRVPTGSMEPTIHVGDHIFVEKAAYSLRIPFSQIHLAQWGFPQRGEILVFKSPYDGITLVKRLIGLPGDHLSVRNGFISINGVPLPGDEKAEEVFRDSNGQDFAYQEEIGGRAVAIQRHPLLSRGEDLSLLIPPGHYFFMGDNRDNSFDSRFWGLVPFENILGRARGALWNLKGSLDPLSLSLSLRGSMEGY